MGTTAQKCQAVGFESAFIIAKERIEYSLKFRKTPTVAIESVLVKEGSRLVLLYAATSKLKF